MQLINLIRLFLALLTAAVLAGCVVGPPGGKWEVESGVLELFESGTILPDHTYYYLGSSAAPDSIIAISNQVTLRTRVWAQVEMSKELLNGWLSWYRTEHYGPGCDYRGGIILTPGGRQAGLWYSQNVINIVRMPEPGVIEVYQPHSISGGTCGKSNDDDRFSNGRF